MDVEMRVLAAACTPVQKGCCITLESRHPTGSVAPCQVGESRAMCPTRVDRIRVEDVHLSECRGARQSQFSGLPSPS